MFRLFKSFNEKCASELLKLKEINRDHAHRWLSAFEQHIREQNEGGTILPEFCLAWCATQHLHKISKSEIPQYEFLASRCPVGVEDIVVNNVSIAICRTKKEKMGFEMREGVEISLRILQERSPDF